MSGFAEELSKKLQHGPIRAGQLVMGQSANGAWELCHERDSPPGEQLLQEFRRVEDARDIAKFAADGRYRVLKAACDLRSGWILRLPTVEDLVRALDLFYPAAIGLWLARERGDVRVIPFRETLSRQTGMYRNAGCISDVGISRIVEGRCRLTCLREILWPEGREPRSEEGPDKQPHQGIPLICSEACHLLMADAARVAKEETEGTTPGR
jgi:hypothetical protein